MPSEPGSDPHRAGDGFAPLPSYIELLMASSAAHATEDRTTSLARPSRLSGVEKAIALSIAGLGLYGFCLVAGGLYLKAVAYVARGGL